MTFDPNDPRLTAYVLGELDPSERAEVEAMESFLRAHPVALVQTRTLNIDPQVYFARVGRPRDPIGMREALERIRDLGVALGNFTHTH